MQSCVVVCNNIKKYAKVCNSMQSCVIVCNNM